MRQLIEEFAPNPFIFALSKAKGMKSKFQVFGLAIAIGLASCSSGGEEKKGKGKEASPEEMKEVKQLQEKVIKVHDEMMPKMGDIKSMKKEAKNLSDSLRDAGDTAVATRLDKTVTRLEKGHKSMMNWMRQFEKPYHEKPDTLRSASASEAIDYLKGQQKKVNAMRDTMMGALEDARTRLDSFE